MELRVERQHEKRNAETKNSGHPPERVALFVMAAWNSGVEPRWRGEKRVEFTGVSAVRVSRKDHAMKTRLLLITALAATIISGPSLLAAGTPAGIPADYKLLYEQDCAQPEAMKDFVFSDVKAWKMSTTNGETSLECVGKSKYNPKDRSPFNIALIADKMFGDFVLECELQSTVKPYPHQDMCLFFGFEATNKFYYTHIAVRPDPVKAESHAHDLFIVNNAPRKCFAKEVSNGVTWGANVWHKIRVERKLADGSIRVYFDDLAKPIMSGEDKTFSAGQVGVGTFDDAGKVRNIRVWGPSVETRPSEFFQRKK